MATYYTRVGMDWTKGVVPGSCEGFGGATGSRTHGHVGQPLRWPHTGLVLISPESLEPCTSSMQPHWLLTPPKLPASAAARAVGLTGPALWC